MVVRTRAFPTSNAEGGAGIKSRGIIDKGLIGIARPHPLRTLVAFLHFLRGGYAGAVLLVAWVMHGG